MLSVAARARAAAPEHELVFPVAAQTIARVVQRAAARAGRDMKKYGGHSLRSGMVTVSQRAGIPLVEGMAASRHESVTVFRGYYREEALRNAAFRAVVDELARRVDHARSRED